MLFQIFKLFGLDIPAKIDALKASFELRVEQVTDHVKQVAQEAAVIAALSAFATLTGVMAVSVGLLALYRWTAAAYGADAWLGVVGALLVVVTVILATAVMFKGKSLAPNRIKLPPYTAASAGMASDPGVAMNAPAGDAGAPKPHTSAEATTSAGDLVEPLALFLSKAVKYPSIGNPVVDELMGTLRAAAYGTADEAIDRAAKSAVRSMQEGITFCSFPLYELRKRNSAAPCDGNRNGDSADGAPLNVQQPHLPLLQPPPQQGHQQRRPSRLPLPHRQRLSFALILALGE
jgi:hypothetical protein